MKNANKPGIRALARRGSMLTKWLGAVLAPSALGVLVLGLASSVSASEGSSTAHCGVFYEGSQGYPSLPDYTESEFTDEAGILVHLEHERAVIDHDGCLFEVERELELEQFEYEVVVLLLEVHAGGTLWMFEDGIWTQSIEIEGASSLSVLLRPDSVYGFVLLAPGQPRPSKPLIVVKPGSENPVP